MENKKKNGIIVTFLVLMLFCGIFSYFKITYSFFGDNITGLLGSLYNINYFANYPSDVVMENEKLVDSKKLDTDYVVKDFMFTIPDNYKFIGWNTMIDGSGTSYKVNDTFKIKGNVTLYAVWESNSLYGDINLDGKVDITDSELLNKYIKENTSLEGILSSNADVNLDGKIDLVDVDIIKQASLGTKGYEGLLSNNPVSIYEVYEGNINNNNNGGGGSSNNGGTNKPSDKPSNNPSNNNGNNNQNNNTGSSSGNGNVNNKDEELPNDDITKEEIEEGIVNKDDKLEQEERKKSYAWILVIGILLISLRFIVLIIQKIIKIKKTDDNDIVK